jgi:hypothetical protein
MVNRANLVHLRTASRPSLIGRMMAREEAGRQRYLVDRAFAIGK